MGMVYVARSVGLQKWGSDVGLGKNLYQLGYAEGDAEAAVKAMNESAHAGHGDWKLVAKEPAEGLSVEELASRLQRKEKMVDPALYPRIKGAVGIFKVKLENAENHILIKKALAGQDPGHLKLKPADIGAYLIAMATG